MSSNEAILPALPRFPLLADLKTRFQEMDPRIPVAAILFIYLVLGLTVLGFNRTPWQALTTTASCLLFELVLHRIFKKVWLFPLSALITSLSLSFLLNYSHDFFLLFVPLFFAIGSKYVFTFRGRHALNPAMVGVSLSLLFSEEMVTAAPAYQWNGISAMSIFIAMLGLCFVIPKVNRHWLVGTFLTVFTLQTALRAIIMRHHLPFETLFLGTLSSPSFFIFTFFMITDPATSPGDRKQQIIVGASLATVDLLLHLRQSYYTFFYAALIVGSTRLIWNHIKAARASGHPLFYVRDSFWRSGYWQRPLLLGAMALGGHQLYSAVIHPVVTMNRTGFYLEKVEPSWSGMDSSEKGDMLNAVVDERVRHVAKWILSVGDSVAIADYDGDGLQDVFLTNPLKKADTRAMLHRNLGGGHFEKVSLPVLEDFRLTPKTSGVVSNAVFSDYDNDGDQDLFLTVGFGHSRLLKNELKETGHATFADVTVPAGVDEFTNSISATFTDLNRDGLLDLVVLNVWPKSLPDYPEGKLLNIFNLPTPQFAGDRRMFNFMHASWHQAENGGMNTVYYQTPGHTFTRADSKAIGMSETHWSLAVAAADFNHDGWPDLYIANDFGPDDLYYNKRDGTFENIKGTIFGSIGRDTYKGMNASAADFDRTGWLGVYISNVHHAFQAEGSLLWMFSAADDPDHPKITEAASAKNVLNEQRFGWGASAVDLDLDGWVDLVQANGMVDDSYDDVRDEKCGDYWYVNEKVARSPPSIHRYADKWGDLRGYCIYGKEKNRAYMNRGTDQKPQFVDAADIVGLSEETNSRGVAAADFDNTGRRDLVITHQFAAPSFYRNRARGEVHPSWIGFELTSLAKECNREAVGTRVTLIVKPRGSAAWSITQEVQTVSGFSGQNDKRVHFGLGTDIESVSAHIEWCGQWKQELPDLKVDQYHQIQFAEAR